MRTSGPSHVRGVNPVRSHPGGELGDVLDLVKLQNPTSRLPMSGPPIPGPTLPVYDPVDVTHIPEPVTYAAPTPWFEGLAPSTPTGPMAPFPQVEFLPRSEPEPAGYESAGPDAAMMSHLMAMAHQPSILATVPEITSEQAMGNDLLEQIMMEYVPPMDVNSGADMLEVQQAIAEQQMMQVTEITPATQDESHQLVQDMYDTQMQMLMNLDYLPTPDPQ